MSKINEKLFDNKENGKLKEEYRFKILIFNAKKR